MTDKPFLFQWRDLIASENGPAPTTRLILLTLSLHMTEDGENGFPSTKTIAHRTGLSERSVCTHLEKAEKEGWVKKSVCGVSGQGWRRHKYTPCILEGTEPNSAPLQQKGTETGSAPHTEGTEPHAEGTEPDDKKALNLIQKALKEVQSNSSYNSSYNSSGNTPNTFALFWTAYPKKRSKGRAEKTWKKLKMNEELFNQIMAGLERAKQSREWTKDGGQFIPHPSTWLNAKGWLDEYDIKPTTGNKLQDKILEVGTAWLEKTKIDS